jgi:broad specificity phosphatase PhoE
LTEYLIIRHAQASFGKANYDALSELGHEQSRRLARWLNEHYDGFDVVLTGAMVRHRETLHAIAESYRGNARALIDAEEIDGLNEFDHRAVLDAFQQRHADHPTALAMQQRATDPRTIYDYLRAGMNCWARTELDDALAEGWVAFSERIARGRDTLLRVGAKARRVLVVTSGGVLAQLARHALNLSPADTIEMNLTIRNSAICEFRHDGDALRLVSWNTLPHLSGPDSRALWTHY